MQNRSVKTASRFFISFGWARFTGAGFFGMEKNSGMNWVRRGAAA